MRKPTSPKIVVGPNDSMPDVLTRLRTATGGPAALAIPASSSLLLTASEFRALKAAAEQARITLTVETDDRLRRQLATMFQIPVIDLLPGAVSDLEEPAVKTEPSESPPAKSSTIMPELPKLSLPPAIEVSPKWSPPKIEEIEDEIPADAPLPEKKRRPLPIPGKMLGVTLAVLVLVVVAAGGIAYVLQTATVTLTLKRERVSTDITYAVVSPGAGEPAGALFTITAAPVSMKVPYQKTIPVTGVLREPDQIATGKLSLRNPTGATVEIVEGSTFTDRNGTEYVFTSAVVVPAADTTNGAGRGEVEIRAVAGGEAANRDTGLLSGKLDNGVYYSNRDAPVAGGTDKKTPVVAQEDIDQLIANANAEIPALAVNTALSDGRSVLPGSIEPGELTYTIDRTAGDLAETVSIVAEMVVGGMAFDPASAVMQATPRVQIDLTALTPDGYELEPESIVLSDPILVNDGGNSGLYRLTATANTRPIIDQSQREEIANAVAGKDVDAATDYLVNLPLVESVQITSSPGFLPVRIPGSAGKVKVETR